MARLRIWVAALTAAMLPAAASAQWGGQIDCSIDTAGPGLKTLLADALIGEGDQAGVERLIGQFSAVADACTAGLTLDAAQKKAYLDYGVSGILREWLTVRLAGFGLSGTTVDTALDFGPGRRNPQLAGEMGEEQVKTLVQALIESGVDAENLSPKAWEAVGTYAAVSSAYWRQRQALANFVPRSPSAPPEPASPAEIKSSPER